MVFVPLFFHFTKEFLSVGSYLSWTATANMVLDHLPVLAIHSESINESRIFLIGPTALGVSCISVYLLCAAVFVVVVLAHLCWLQCCVIEAEIPASAIWRNKHWLRRKWLGVKGTSLVCSGSGFCFRLVRKIAKFWLKADDFEIYLLQHPPINHCRRYTINNI